MGRLVASPALKACPFCGKRKRIEFEPNPLGRGEGPIVCGNCGARGPDYGQGDLEAAALWNNRPTRGTH